tara:strand:+ start:2713 stop:4062 length:1350 start_codon:yes stop_codon:yes gene_type:complete
MKNIFNILKNYSAYIYFILISIVLIFDRSAVGIYISGFQLGKLMIGLSLILTIVFLTFKILNKNIFELQDFKSSQNVLFLIVISFIGSLIIHNTDIFSEYTYKSSSYIWTVGIFFTSLYIFSDVKRYIGAAKYLIYPALLLPFVHYIFSTGYYPNFIMDIFIKYSDKFSFNKASDIMLALISLNFINYKITLNKTFKIFYLVTSVSLLLPLLLLMSRGSFLSAFIFLAGTLLFDWRFIFLNLKKTIPIMLFGVGVFILSTYNVSDVSFNFNFGSEQQQEGLSDNIEKIAKKNNTRKAFLSFYFNDGRIYSIDNTTNWRLDIWQDVVEDMNKKNIIIIGYGYNEIIPVMLDPSAPGRLGRDGLNENVHNYLINILARGGIFQLLLFVIFHITYIRVWYKRYNNYEILIFIIPAMLNSFLDITMEGVQFPFVYYSMLGVFFNTEKLVNNKY